MKVTKQDIYTEIQRVADKLQVTKLSINDYRHANPAITVSTVVRCCGTWSNACAEAGVSCSNTRHAAEQRHISNQDMLIALYEANTQKGTWLTAADDWPYSVGEYVHRFESVEQAHFHAELFAGFDAEYDQIIKRRIVWTLDQEHIELSIFQPEPAQQRVIEAFHAVGLWYVLESSASLMQIKAYATMMLRFYRVPVGLIRLEWPHKILQGAMCDFAFWFIAMMRHDSLEARKFRKQFLPSPGTIFHRLLNQPLE